MKKLLVLLPLTLSLAGCPLNQTTAPASTGTGTASAGVSPASISSFLTKLESTRGSALSVTEKASVTAAVGQTRSLLDGTQNKFLNTVSQFTGLDSATLGAIVPQSTAPVSQLDLLNKLESKLGRKLSGAESTAAKTAATLRNNSLDSVKSGLANKVGKVVGMDGDTVQAMLPLLGF